MTSLTTCPWALVALTTHDMASAASRREWAVSTMAVLAPNRISLDDSFQGWRTNRVLPERHQWPIEGGHNNR